MKRTIPRWLPLLILAVATALSVHAQKIYLSHGGQLTAYAISEMDKALNASVKNDTIFLPEGAIPGFEVTKDITICGAGPNTVVSGNITINPADTTAHWENTLLDGLYVNGMVQQGGPAKGLTIRNTNMDRYTNCRGDSVSKAYDNIDCQYISCNFRNGATNIIGSNTPPRKISNIKFVNCRINNPNKLAVLGSFNYAPPVGALNFHNCTFNNFVSVLSGSYQIYSISATNCIFSAGSTNDYYPLAGSSVLTNCLLNYYGKLLSNGPVRNNSWYITESTKCGNENNPENLIGLGYIGTDGTCVGHLGGGIPYSLESSLPFVKERKVEVDYDKNVINVTLKFSGTEEE